MPSPAKTLANPGELEKHFSPKLLETAPERASALKKYLKEGGVVRLHARSRGWPLLLYPTRQRLQAKSEACARQLQELQRQRRDWEAKLRQAERYHLVHGIKKLSSPLYWRHLAKTLAEPEYKKAAEKVQLPVHLVSDPKWAPMIETFINNPDYRQQLTETVEKSIIYRKDKRLARYANTLLAFRKEECQRKIAAIDQKIRQLEETRRVLARLAQWAAER